MKRIALCTFFLLVMVYAAFAQGALPDYIQIDQTDLAPEGLVYDEANGRFLISSLSEGTVYAVADDGTTTPFIEDPNLISSALTLRGDAMYLLYGHESEIVRVDGFETGAP